LYQAGQQGGELVYSYAGGVGIRSGDTSDVERLLVAGLYEQALVDRARHKSAEAADLIEQLARRLPGDTTVQLLRIESQIVDRQDPAGALAALQALMLPANNPRLRIQAGTLTADALVAAGRPDSARAVLRALVAEFPMSRRLKDRLTQLGG
jgi:predicted Zn-dependent protease